jgi:hypothetical protein
MSQVQCHQQDSNSTHNIQGSHFVAPSVSNPLIVAQPSTTMAPSLSAGSVSSCPAGGSERHLFLKLVSLTAEFWESVFFS